MADDGGLGRFNRRMDAIKKAATESVRPSLSKSGNEIADAMRTIAETSRDTGALIESIAVTEAGETTPPYSSPGGSMMVPENAVMITAGNTDVRYAHLIEYGSVKNIAQPFFWPAYRLLKKRVERRTKREIRKAVREAWDKQ